MNDSQGGSEVVTDEEVWNIWSDFIDKLNFLNDIFRLYIKHKYN